MTPSANPDQPPAPPASPLRIAHFHSTLPEPGRKVGGVEVFVHRLANRLVDHGHEVAVFTFGVRPRDAKYTKLRAGPPWLAAGRVTRLAVAPWVLNGLPLDGFDVLHLHGDDWFMWRRRIPTVRTFYGSALSESRTATSRRRRLSQGLVYPLEAAASHMATLSFDIGSKLPFGYRVEGALALAVPDPWPSAAAVHRARRPTILFVGTWDGRKRGSFLADRFIAQVLPEHPDATLVMVSDRCEEQQGIKWVPSPSDEQMSRLYREAWVFCMPSTYEGFGMPYLEAMTHGLPVVATPNAGAELVLGVGAGILAADEDLGHQLSRLLANPLARDQLANAGRARAANFSWDRALSEHVGAYRRAVESFRGGRSNAATPSRLSRGR